MQTMKSEFAYDTTTNKLKQQNYQYQVNIGGVDTSQDSRTQ